MHRLLVPVLILIFCIAKPIFADPTTQPFDGSRWNVSTGNLSVQFIQASPIGAQPRENYLEPAPPVESQVALKHKGLIANEDYIAWGAIEREPGKWNWQQHDAVEQNLHKAGLKYVAYNWIHFPPAWLRDRRKGERTLMRCLEHDKETHYLSIFDPKTIEWYDHFYKNINAHFGDKVDDIYACILGPYGEGNYPLFVPDWVNMGHCHEGYWCGDPHAVKAHRSAMEQRYKTIEPLNTAWGTSFKSFDEIDFPPQIKHSPRITPDLFKNPHERRRWLDFITWYHQAIIDFAERSIQTVLKYYPPEKVRLKPGGTARGVNPIAWGTYSPGYAKMAAKYKIVLQPADCGGAVFADKWLATAYQFYGVKLGTEPAGGLNSQEFVRRMFSDASCGAAQLFTYEFEQHVPEIQRYVHLYTGQPGETEIALYCPTTLYRLGGDLKPTIEAGYPLRDVCEFDVLDELLITDGALNDRYKALIIVQADLIERSILDKIEKWTKSGGQVLILDAAGSIRDVTEQRWAANFQRATLQSLPLHLKDRKGYDGEPDGLWTCRRGNQVFMFNSTGKPVSRAVTIQAQTLTANVEPHAIWISP